MTNAMRHIPIIFTTLSYAAIFGVAIFYSQRILIHVHLKTLGEVDFGRMRRNSFW
jgi:hypothetical protein